MNKKLIATICLLAAFCFSGSARAGAFFNDRHVERGSGDQETEIREVEPFERIEMTTSGDLIITAGQEQHVEVTIDNNLLDNVTTEVVGRQTLLIESEHSFSSRRGLKIEVSVPQLTRLSISGSADVRIYDLDQDSFEISLSGSGDIEVDGNVKDVEIRVTGSGDIDAHDLIAKEANVTISGSGDVIVHATEYFDGEVIGSGDIEYYGHPEHVSKRVTGSGDITRR